MALVVSRPDLRLLHPEDCVIALIDVVVMVSALRARVQ